MIQGLQYIFRDAGIPEADSLTKAAEFLLSDAIASVPFDRISASLFAVMAMKAAAGQREPPNRGTAVDININIVSALLPYCDAMFVDNRCRALLLDVPQEYKLPYGGRVFSRNNGEEFLEYLKRIRAECPAEHIQVVHEVYGPDWVKPYTSIFVKSK